MVQEMIGEERVLMEEVKVSLKFSWLLKEARRKEGQVGLADQTSVPSEVENYKQNEFL